MKRKILVILATPLVLLVVFRVIFFRPIDYFGNLDKFLIDEILSSEGIEVPTLSSEEFLVLLENHYIRRNLNPARRVTSIVPRNDFILISFRGYENRNRGSLRTMVIDLELSTVMIPGNIPMLGMQRLVDYYLIDPERFIEELLNFE